MNRLKWGLLLVAAACGGKTIEDPLDGDDDGNPAVPVPTSTPPSGTGGTTGSPPPPSTAGTVAVGGSVGTGGSVAVGKGGSYGKGGSPASGGYGGIPYDYAEYGLCDGVALLPPVDWIDGASGPAEISAAIIGDWIGHAMSPWGEWDVEFSFHQDGNYSAYPLTPDAIALYYGTDLDSPLKRWWLTGAGPVKGAFGEIDIVFDDGGTFTESGYQGYLDCVHTDAASDRLRFEFWYDSEGPRGPFVYDLQRL